MSRAMPHRHGAGKAAAGKQGIDDASTPKDRDRSPLYIAFNVALDKPRLWSLADPYLHEVEVTPHGGEDEDAVDRVSTYFGMRKISVMNLPGTDIPYIALNNKPVYLQMALDQAYHPEGYYTFPSDEFMRDEILRSRNIGLNGQRIHIKVEATVLTSVS